MIGGIAVRFGLGSMPALCLVAPGMIIVPGVPLINGVQDMIANHMTLGISRLGFGGVVTIAIAMGLFTATVLTGAVIPVEEATQAISVPEDAVFSALAALGFVLLFSVPARLAWICILCGIASHTLRTFCVHFGVDIISGTLLGALTTGILAEIFGRRFRAPPAAFAFPGVVAMVPGSYAFRMVIGGLQIANGAADPGLITATLALGVETALMLAAIAVGIAAPALLLPRHPLARPAGNP